MNHLDAIEAVLKGTGVPMSCKEIAAEVIQQGLIADYGKTLDASFNRDLNQGIAKGDGRFVKVSPGRFALVGGVAESARGKGRRVKLTSDAGLKGCEGKQSKQISTKGFVYILRDSYHRNCVKIGKTSGSLEKRIRQLQTGNPWIREYVSLETSRYDDVERFLHNVIKLISKNRQVETSEFYRFDPEDAKAILMEFERLLPPRDFRIVEAESAASGSGDRHQTKKRFFRPRRDVLFCVSRGADAKGYRDTDGFVVLAGSRICLDPAKSFVACKCEVGMREKFLKDGTIVGDKLTRDVKCSSISSAARLVMAVSANGKREWKQTH